MGTFYGGKDWGPVLTAMVTAFNGDGSVNYDETVKIADHLVSKQANSGLVISGTTGESPTLSDDEKIEILKAVLTAVGDKAAVVFGSGSNSTAHTIELTKRAEKAGADAIMLVNPYYSKPGQRGLHAHFKTAAEATGLPVMLYNIQPRSAINLDTETLVSLLDVPNIVAVKEASGIMSQISEVCQLRRPEFRVYSGDDALTLPMLSLGAHGVVSVAAHVVGAEIAKMVSSFPSNPGEAARIHHQLWPVFKELFSAPSPTPVKYALSRDGFDCEAVRLPLVPLTEVDKKRVDAALGAARREAVAV